MGKNRGNIGIITSELVRISGPQINLMWLRWSWNHRRTTRSGNRNTRRNANLRSTPPPARVNTQKLCNDLRTPRAFPWMHARMNALTESVARPATTCRRPSNTHRHITWRLRMRSRVRSWSALWFTRSSVHGCWRRWRRVQGPWKCEKRSHLPFQGSHVAKSWRHRKYPPVHTPFPLLPQAIREQ